MKAETLAQLLESRSAGRVPVWFTPLGDQGEEFVLYPLEGEWQGGPRPLLEAAKRAVATDLTTEVEVDSARYLVRPFNPAARLVVVGAVHVAQSLVPIATTAGLDVTIVDPRPDWVSDFRFPDVRSIRAWPEEAFEQLAVDHRTAVVTLTHDPKVDDPALVAALRSPAFYVGALGSRRTHARRVERLADAGLDPEELARIRSPVGLDIGARNPPEIAVAVLAEVIQTLRSPAS